MLTSKHVESEKYILGIISFIKTKLQEKGMFHELTKAAASGFPINSNIFTGFSSRTKSW